MAILGIDHLVIAVRDPDAAATVLERELGLAFTGGGRHAGAGTWNRLAFLGDAYLELIGVFDRRLVASGTGVAIGRAALALLDAGREGLATWSLAVDDCAAEVARLHERRSPIGDPVAGSRLRPDGETVRWVTAFPELGPDCPPFLIEHEPKGAEWGPDALAARQAFRHPGLGRARLDRLELPTPDAPAYAARCEAVLGVRFDAGPGGWAAVVGRDVVRLRPPGEACPVVGLRPAPRRASLRSAQLLGIDWRVAGG